MLKISWPQFLSGVFVLIVTVAGGSFTVCKFAKDGEVAEYRLRIGSLERRVQELEKRLELCLKASNRQTVNKQTRISNPVINAPFVKIIEPKSGSLVEKFNTIRFSVHGSLPTGVQPLLLVRDPLGQWWSWGKSNTGEFSRVQIGVDQDKGESFEIRLLLTEEELPRNQPHPDLPRSIASDSVIVIRK